MAGEYQRLERQDQSLETQDGRVHDRDSVDRVQEQASPETQIGVG
jgi:hypothetical protein